MQILVTNGTGSIATYKATALLLAAVEPVVLSVSESGPAPRQAV